MKKNTLKFDQKKIFIIAIILLSCLAELFLYKNGYDKSYQYVLLAFIVICFIMLFVKDTGKEKDYEEIIIDEAQWIHFFQDIHEKNARTVDALLSLDVPIEIRIVLENKDSQCQDFLKLVDGQSIYIKTAIEGLYALLKNNSYREWEYAYQKLNEYIQNKNQEKIEKNYHMLSLVIKAIFMIFVIVVFAIFIIKFTEQINV